MSEKFVPIGQQSIIHIAQKLREIGDDEAASKYEGSELGSVSGLEGYYNAPRAYLNTQHQYGFIPRFDPSVERYHDIKAASEIPPDELLQDAQISIKLDYLRVHQYPAPLINLGNNVHTILFTFEVRHPVQGGSELIAFNQTYKAKSGQDAAVTGDPIFVGLNVGADGVVFSCQTVNVGNSDDQKLVEAINSDAATLGLNLLTTAQPAIAPFVSVAKGLSLSLANRRKNIPVQEFTLGLDFDKGAPGVRLSIGSYVVAQVARANEINWSDWQFDSKVGTIVRVNLAEGEDPYILPYNTVVFRISRYRNRT